MGTTSKEEWYILQQRYYTCLTIGNELTEILVGWLVHPFIQDLVFNHQDVVTKTRHGGTHL